MLQIHLWICPNYATEPLYVRRFDKRKVNSSPKTGLSLQGRDWGHSLGILKENRKLIIPQWQEFMATICISSVRILQKLDSPEGAFKF